MEAIAVLIKLEYHFKLFTVEVAEDKGGRVRIKVEMSFIFIRNPSSQ